MTAENPEISVVVPVHDEAGAAVPLAREIAQAFAGRSYEMIFVDDASRDATLAELRAAMAELPALRVLSHGTNAGQSRPRAIAPPITNISEGSQGMERSRKPITLAGLAMPEMIKPQPKTKPARPLATAKRMLFFTI